MPIKLPDLGKPLQSALRTVDREVQKVAAKVQTATFRGPVGDVMANGTKQGWVAEFASKLNLSAFKPAPPPPTLKRPMVMVTGLTMQAASYDPMAKHLAGNKANGPVVTYVVADGKFHLGGVNGKVLTDAEAAKAKLFQVQYTEVRGAPSDKAPQLAQAFSAIERVTQAPTMDVVAHSAGCTDFRLYLDSRTPEEKAAVKFNQAVLIGPATRGTFMGNVGDAVGGVLGVEEAGQELEIGSKLVGQLNQTWDRQRAQVKAVTIVGISGAPTMGQGGLGDGDGFMRVKDLPLPHADTVVLRGADPSPVAHLMEVAYSGVIAEVQKRL
ncbi:MAG: alpha/beta hydrolase [Myxococcales bacterium]|nr:alpha/beta hydrolase [Myxococcales bacterium]